MVGERKEGLPKQPTQDRGPRCPSCTAFPRLTHALLDTRKGTTVPVRRTHLGRLSECKGRADNLAGAIAERQTKKGPSSWGAWEELGPTINTLGEGCRENLASARSFHRKEKYRTRL